MLDDINAINHAMLIPNSVIEDPIYPNINTNNTSVKYPTSCDFIVKKSSGQVCASSTFTA